MELKKEKDTLVVRFNSNEDFKIMPSILKRLYFRYNPIDKTWGRAYNSFIENSLTPFSTPSSLYNSKPTNTLFKILRPYQQEILIEMIEQGKKGLWLEMGLGKTLLAIMYAKIKKYKRILVLCPKAVISVWQEEIIKFTKKEYKIFIGKDTSKNKKEELFNMLRNKSKCFYITNYESVLLKEIQNVVWDLIIFDESSKLKHYNTKRTKGCFTLNSKDAISLTGTPITNSIEDIFSQFFFINVKEFGISRPKFQQEYCKVDYFGKTIGIKEEKEGKLEEILKRNTIRRTKKEVALDLPDKIYEKRIISFSEEHFKNYKKLELTSILEIENQIINPKTILTALLRLREICGGFYREQGKLIKLGCINKLEALVDTIEELGKNCVIMYNFLPEEYIICNEIKNTMTLEDYNKGMRGKHLVMNASRGYGLNLQEDYDTIIFYSQMYSREIRKQAENRIHRIGSTGALIIDLLYQNTIEELIYKERDNLIKAFERLLEKVKKENKGIKFKI